MDNRNELLETMRRKKLAAIRRTDLDAAFQQMADDRAYQQEVKRIAEESESASWEAWQLAEDDS